MEPLTKLLLNNKIVEMRHSVRQSRIQSINKLVKEIKKLREKKGTDEQKAKNTSKAERYVEIIQIMKKVKDDDVSKFALMNEKSLAEITNNVNEQPEIKAVARIANHRPIFEKVKAFREQYPDWKETLPLLFDTLGEKHQNKKKKPQTKTSQVKNKAKTQTENRNVSNVTYIHNRVGTWKVEEISEANKTQDPHSKPSKDEKQSKNNNNIKLSKKESRKFSTSSYDSLDDEISEEDSTLESNQFIKKHTNIPSKNSKQKVKHIEKRDNELGKEDINSEKITKTVDPFFVTKDNKEYLSVNVVKNPNIDIEENKTNFSESKFDKKFTPSKFSEKNRNQFKPYTKKEYPKLEKKEEALHPSWEAKRKQSAITTFQGKKIKFDT